MKLSNMIIIYYLNMNASLHIIIDQMYTRIHRHVGLWPTFVVLLYISFLFALIYLTSYCLIITLVIYFWSTQWIANDSLIPLVDIVKTIYSYKLIAFIWNAMWKVIVFRYSHIELKYKCYARLNYSIKSSEQFYGRRQEKKIVSEMLRAPF